MPKPFLIGVEVEEIAFGRVMRKIDELPGVVKIHLSFSKEKLGGKPNGAGQTRGPYKTRGTFEKTGQEAIIDALNGKPPMTLAQLRDVFVAQKRSPKSISSCLHEMFNEGEVQRTDDGYTLTKKVRDRLRSRAKSAKKK